ncbi:MAG: elongation factor P hydroxylase, partial [Pseudomonadales bacterium]|nr:elongation factor P hydroxylase [Pseudomonadales bacterium]
SLFHDTYKTVLVKGGEEPLFLPASINSPYSQVIFARGYFSSALHEISHWCIAGEQRRTQVDYGYWYVPDGRSEQQQMAFEQAEIKPQALEWIFSVAAGHPFHISIDNLGGVTFDHPNFALNLYQQVMKYLREGMPVRAQLFLHALVDYYQNEIMEDSFDIQAL